ncbi:MAG: hypothetical protein HN919_07710 [Verrucomicrobia bacterium]|jgi:hypothetical protein|nr:hypothetical protein [Verrucomicrobiota bacterium]
MKHRRILWTTQLCCHLAVLLALAASEARAYENMSLRSRYMGDGWFRYDMTLHEDPFFHSYNSCGLLVQMSDFAGFGSIPDGWYTHVTAGGQVQVSTNTYPSVVARPMTATIWLQSSNTTYKTVESSAVSCSATCKFNDLLENPFGSVNMAYVLQMRSIAPCRPEEADGSESNCFDVVEIFPDLRMNGFVSSNGVLGGVSFSWDRECTALVRASNDLVHWTDVEHFLFSPPQTDWIASTELESLGDFFRAAIVSLQHKPELLSVSTANLCAEARTNDSKDSSCVPQITLTPGGIRIAPRSSSPGRYRMTVYEDSKTQLPSDSLLAGPDGITLSPAPLAGIRAVFVSIHEVE